MHENSLFSQLQDYPRAAAAATTFLAVNPKHSYMNNNKENYKNILNVTAEHFVDLEAGEYEVSSLCSHSDTNYTVCVSLIVNFKHQNTCYYS